MSLFEALWLAMLQGFSELFPISSLGHTVILPALIGWHIDQRSTAFLPFVVTLHLGTAAALLTFFWQDWLALTGALVRSVVRGKLSGNADERLAWLLVVGTIPAGLLGFFLEKPLRALFAAPAVAAAFLVVNGAIMFAGERLRRRQDRTRPLIGDRGSDLQSLTLGSALGIGLAQSAALIPGISRSGTTIVAGLLLGLRHEPAARFSFLLATPLIFAAGLLEVPVLLGPEGRATLGLAAAGGLAAAITAWLSVRFLMRYFTFGRLDPFAYYCWAFGALSLAVIGLR